jgi:hypothetical protein
MYKSQKSDDFCDFFICSEKNLKKSEKPIDWKKYS